LNVIKQFSCVPNHRSIEELCTVLLWLLAAGGSKADDGDEGDANSIKSVFAFDEGIYMCMYIYIYISIYLLIYIYMYMIHIQ
jgi:hypothetical protein